MKRDLPKEAFARRLVRRFPEFQWEYQDHLRGYGELLGHVFRGYAERGPLSTAGG